MKIQTFFDERTCTLTYLVYIPETKDAVVIDPVLDYDAAASRVFTESADRVIEFVRARDLTVRYVLETHAHADHLSGSRHLKEACPSVKVAIGARITEVQETFKTVFDLPEGFATDGSQFDRLLDDGETLEAGSLVIGVIATPGHTPACVTYKIEDTLFTGDVLFMPDYGTGRCDFPGGNVAEMYHSIASRLYAMSDATRVFVGHDYQPGGRDLAFQSTIGEQKASNIALRGDTSEDAFLKYRKARDAGLNAPKLLFQSVQVNIDAGRLPEPHANNIRYLEIPLNVFRPELRG